MTSYSLSVLVVAEISNLIHSQKLAISGSFLRYPAQIVSVSSLNDPFDSWPCDFG